MKYEWNEEKNKILQSSRGVSFEQVVEEISKGDFIGPEDNPARDNQKIIIVKLNGYPCIVPFVETDDGWFFKTIYQSRKAKRRFTNES